MNQKARPFPQSDECKKELLLSLEAFQALAITSARIAEAFFPSIPKETLDYYGNQLKSCRDREHCSGVYRYCFLLFYSMGNNALSEIYSQLMWLTLWPVSYRDLWLDTEEMLSLLNVILTSLENRDAKLFSQAVSHLFYGTFRTLKAGMIRGGLEEAANVVLIGPEWI